MDVVNRKMKILFITGLYLPELEKEIIEEGKEKYLQVAANNLQWALVKGLCENNVTSEVISCPFLPCWLHGYNHLFTPSIFYQYSPHVAIESLKYCTCLGIKNFFIGNSIEQYTERWIKKNGHDSLYIIVYHTIGYVMKAIANIKKKYPQVRTAVIIADLFYSNPYKI